MAPSKTFRKSRKTGSAPRTELASVQITTCVVIVPFGPTRRVAQRPRAPLSQLPSAVPTVATSCAPELCLNTKTTEPRTAQNPAPIEVCVGLASIITIAAQTKPRHVPNTPQRWKTLRARPYGKTQVVTGVAIKPFLGAEPGPLLGQVVAKVLEMVEPLVVIAFSAGADRRRTRRPCATITTLTTAAFSAVEVRKAPPQVARPFPASETITGSVTKTKNLDPPPCNKAPKAPPLQRTPSIASPS